MKIYLMVYFVKDIKRSKAFFENIGLTLTEERHEHGPLHYSTTIGGTVFEIYPSGDGKPISRTRIGLDFSESAPLSDDALNFIKENSDSLHSMNGGKSYAVITDPNENKVELFW